MSSDYLFEREFEDLGLVVHVAPMLFNDRVLVSVIGSPCYLDAWCFDKGRAVVAAEAFDLAAGHTEPVGWKKHPATGRYREGGDPAREEVLQ